MFKLRIKKKFSDRLFIVEKITTINSVNGNIDTIFFLGVKK